jgi:hypothetical protein
LKGSDRFEPLGGAYKMILYKYIFCDIFSRSSNA